MKLDETAARRTWSAPKLRRQEIKAVTANGIASCMDGNAFMRAGNCN